MKKKLRETYRMLIEAVYAKWNSEKIDDVPRLMEKYKDQEAEIYDRIVQKYVFCRSQKDWQPLIEAMYARFNPSKLQELDGIFMKYKDGEAALYRALCDKYLPTLTKDDKPLVFQVWETCDAISIEEPEEEVVRLVSPSQEKEETRCDEHNDVRFQRDSMDKEPGTTEEVSRKNKDQKKRTPKTQDGAEVFPPLLPRQLAREKMAGAELAVTSSADPLQTQGKERGRKSRQTEAFLRPKAAPRPRGKILDSAGIASQMVETQPAMRQISRTKRPKVRKENDRQETPEGSSAHLHVRKKRKVSTPCAPDESTFEAPAPVGQPSGPSMLLTESQSTLDQRRQQLKEKLFELKTQISIQEAPSTHFPVHSLKRDAVGFDDASSYSYSDEDKLAGAEAERAENRTVVLRNKLEAQLRRKVRETLNSN